MARIKNINSWDVASPSDWGTSGSIQRKFSKKLRVRARRRLDSYFIKEQLIDVEKLKLDTYWQKRVEQELEEYKRESQEHLKDLTEYYTIYQCIIGIRDLTDAYTKMVLSTALKIHKSSAFSSRKGNIPIPICIEIAKWECE